MYAQCLWQTNYSFYHTQCYNGHTSIKHIIAVSKSHGIKNVHLHCVVHLFSDNILPDYLFKLTSLSLSLDYILGNHIYSGRVVYNWAMQSQVM